MNVRLISCAIVAACLLAAARPSAGGAKPAPDGSKLTAAQWAEKMAQYIETVRTNHVPDAVVLAYRAGRKIDSKNVQLHQIHMRRMLEFGLLHMAYAPADAMVKLQARNATAFATAGHMQATRGNYAEALAMYVQAAQMEKDDVSIRFNLGQLLAWYELEGAGKVVSDRIQRAIDEIKPRKYHTVRDPLGRGYARGRSVYKDRDNVGRKYRREIDSLTRSISVLEKRIAEQAKASDSTLVAVKRKRLEEELARARKLSTKTSSASLKKLYRKQIASVTASLRKLDSPGGGSGAADRQSLAAKKSRLDEVLAERKKAVGAAGASWRWDPPMLNGKVIEVVPLIAGSTVIPAVGEEASAAARLKIARLLATHDQPARAVPRLKQIILLYPATEAAAEARKLLADLPE